MHNKYFKTMAITRDECEEHGHMDMARLSPNIWEAAVPTDHAKGAKAAMPGWVGRLRRGHLLGKDRRRYAFRLAGTYKRPTKTGRLVWPHAQQGLVKMRLPPGKRPRFPGGAPHKAGPVCKCLSIKTQAPPPKPGTARKVVEMMRGASEDNA